MSEEFVLSVKPLSTLNIEADDARNVREFFNHFELKIPDYLENALKNYEVGYEAFKKSGGKSDAPTPDILYAQDQVRVQLCRAMVEHESPVFKDDLFKVVIENSKQIAFAAFFEKELEAELKS